MDFFQQTNGVRSHEADLDRASSFSRFPDGIRVDSLGASRNPSPASVQSSIPTTPATPASWPTQPTPHGLTMTPMLGLDTEVSAAPGGFESRSLLHVGIAWQDDPFLDSTGEGTQPNGLLAFPVESRRAIEVSGMVPHPPRVSTYYERPSEVFRATESGSPIDTLRIDSPHYWLDFQGVSTFAETTPLDTMANGLQSSPVNGTTLFDQYPRESMSSSCPPSLLGSPGRQEPAFGIQGSNERANSLPSSLDDDQDVYETALRSVARTRERRAPPAKPDQRDWICEICGIAVSRKYNLLKHVQKKHTNICRQDFRCEWLVDGKQCRKAFDRRADLSRHVDSKHKKVKISCPACSYASARLDTLRRHVEKGCKGRRTIAKKQSTTQRPNVKICAKPTSASASMPDSFTQLSPRTEVPRLVPKRPYPLRAKREKQLH